MRGRDEVGLSKTNATKMNDILKDAIHRTRDLVRALVNAPNPFKTATSQGRIH